MLFFPSADQSSKSLYISLFRPSQSSTVDSTQPSMASVLLKMSQFVLDLANTVPKPVKVLGLAATFVTQFANARCYVTPANTHIDIIPGSTLSKRDYSENLHLFVTQVLGYNASNLANDTTLCPTGDAIKRCIKITSHQAEQYGIDYKYFRLISNSNYTAFSQEFKFLLQVKDYLCTKEVDIGNRVMIGMVTVLSLAMLLGLCANIIAGCKKTNTDSPIQEDTIDDTTTLESKQNPHTFYYKLDKHDEPEAGESDELEADNNQSLLRYGV